MKKCKFQKGGKVPMDSDYTKPMDKDFSKRVEEENKKRKSIKPGYKKGGKVKKMAKGGKTKKKC